MLLVLSYDLCALILAAIIIFVSVYKKHFDILQHRTFMLLAAVQAACSAFSVAAKYMAYEAGTYPPALIIFFIRLTAGLDILFPLLFVVYCMSVFDQDIADCRRSVKTALYFPVVAELYFLIFQSGNSYLFGYEPSTGSLTGPGTIMFGAVSLYYVIFAVCFSIPFGKYSEQSEIISLCMASLFIALGITANMLSEDFITGDLLYAMGLVVIRMLDRRSEDYIDLLTGVPNTNAFRRCFEINGRTRRYNELYILYIENLRLLNLTVGFTKVNKVIGDIAAYLDDITEQDVFYVDQGTFILMPKLLPSEKEIFFDGMRGRFACPWNADGMDLLVSMRIMEVKLPSDAENADKVYSFADYLRSMKGSMDDYFYASDVALRNNSRVLMLESCIKRALEEGNFKVFYQPIYSTAARKIVSAEALIRLIDPEHGFVSPADFIPVAEENGSIIQIGHFVLESVFDFIADNDFKKLGLGYVEINLSVVQCMQQDLAQTISKMARNRGVDSLCVNLEITETAAAERPLMLMRNMKHLVEQKYTFSLDDFGTGYSNISSMMDMPLEIIKFDKSIIDRLLQGEEGRILVDSLAAMVKKMGKKIVAEGVETKEQLDELVSVGVDYIQGFYFSKPLPAEDFIEFVTKFNDIGE